MEIVSLPISLRELSHELRIPLTGILGNATLLKDELLTQEQRSYVNDIITSGNALVMLADRLLEAKKIQSNAEYIEAQK